MSGLLLPLIVFAAELFVVTLSTIRIIFVSRGRKAAASILGFFEITLWLFAIGQIMQNLQEIGCYLGFATGFTIGNYLGILIEKRLALGTLLVRIITRRNAVPLIRGLQSCRYGVTSIDGQGTRGPVKIIFTVIQRKEFAKVLGIIRAFDPNAFYSVDEITSVGPGIYPAAAKKQRGLFPLALLDFFRGSTGMHLPERVSESSLEPIPAAIPQVAGAE